MIRSIIAGAIAAAVTLGTGLPALADVGAKDVQVAAKTFGFTVPPLTGTVTVAVVFDPGVPASQADADQLKTILGSGLAVGTATLVPVLVPVAQLDGGLDGANVAFLTGGLSAHHERIFAATKAKKLLSVSADTSCVQSARCVMGVKSEPKVEILVNKAAAEASSVSFAPAFRMMISEL
ncbi:hypothetical protein [Azospirillum halopraeferens]|uniref:hypothetical protein n=1 Tax=Azospirillum halopraeferens TaxID=34010 RepID=UPI000409908D|nr:hypothetical protein [Azospirillum halopraeferens]